MAAREDKRDAVTGGTSAALALAATACGIVSLSDTHWLDSNDASYPDGHVGLWRACDLFALPPGGCVPLTQGGVVDRVDPLLTLSQLQRLHAARVLLLLGVVLVGMAAGAAGLVALGHRRVPLRGLAAVPLAHDVVATVLMIIALVLVSGVAGDGAYAGVGPLRRRLSMRYGYSLAMAILACVGAALAAMPLMGSWEPKRRGGAADAAGGGGAGYYASLGSPRRGGLVDVP